MMRKVLFFFVVVGALLGLGWVVMSRAYGVAAEVRDEVRSFTRLNGFNEEYCVIVDFSRHSGRYRYYLYDIVNDRIAEQGLVAHGGGRNGECRREPKFSNVVGSNLSSPGKYRIGRQRKTHFRIRGEHCDCLELHGLESSNSNAYSRAILIHTGLRYTFPTFPLRTIPTSHGCFTVGDEVFEATAEIVRNSGKPVLLYALE
ncbi:MAG: hypothetical protein HDS33_08130 [Bacteroides sp.]|nr:hypothetical protein [Bacteroides sp.]